MKGNSSIVTRVKFLRGCSNRSSVAINRSSVAIKVSEHFLEGGCSDTLESIYLNAAVKEIKTFQLPCYHFSHRVKVLPFIPPTCRGGEKNVVQDSIILAISSLKLYVNQTHPDMLLQGKSLLKGGPTLVKCCIQGFCIFWIGNDPSPFSGRRLPYGVAAFKWTSLKTHMCWGRRAAADGSIFVAVF